MLGRLLTIDRRMIFILIGIGFLLNGIERIFKLTQKEEK